MNPSFRIRALDTQRHIDAHLPTRGVSWAGLKAGPPPGTPDFVGQLIAENDDLWQKLVNHPFGAAIAAGTANMDGFDYYMIQDLLYLRNYVHYKLGYFSKANWDEIQAAKTSISDDIDYADGQLKVCMDDLGIQPQQVLGTPAADMVEAYMDWLNKQVITEDWFSLHIMMLPCLLGYSAIGKKWSDDPTTAKNTIYYQLWIGPNASYDGQKYRDFCNQNYAQYDSLIERADWKTLFRKACRMEIAFFDTALNPPILINPVPPGTYKLQNFMAKAVAKATAAAVGSQIVGSTDTGSDDEKWIVAKTDKGYSIQNVKFKTYASVKNCDQWDNITLVTAQEPTMWYIVPSKISKIDGAFQILLASKQANVWDLAGGSADPGTKILAYPNVLGASLQQGQNQAWVFA